MLFGWPVKAMGFELIAEESSEDVQVDDQGRRRRDLAFQYDGNLDKVTRFYEEQMMYNFFAKNCHHFCCDVLNEFERGLAGKADNNQCNHARRSVQVLGEERRLDEVEPFEALVAQEEDSDDSNDISVHTRRGESSSRSFINENGSSRIILKIHGGLIPLNVILNL